MNGGRGWGGTAGKKGGGGGKRKGRKGRGQGRSGGTSGRAHGGGARHRRTPTAAAAVAVREHGVWMVGCGTRRRATVHGPQIPADEGVRRRANVSSCSRPRTREVRVRPRLPPARVQRACRDQPPSAAAAVANPSRVGSLGGGASSAKRPTPPWPHGRAPARSVDSPAHASPAPRPTRTQTIRRHLAFPPPPPCPKKPQQFPAAQWGARATPAGARQVCPRGQMQRGCQGPGTERVGGGFFLYSKMPLHLYAAPGDQSAGATGIWVPACLALGRAARLPWQVVTHGGSTQERAHREIMVCKFETENTRSGTCRAR